jgi:hypothetical protein
MPLGCGQINFSFGGVKMVCKSVFSFQFWFQVVGAVLFCGLPAQIDTLTTLICGYNDFFELNFL